VKPESIAEMHAQQKSHGIQEEGSVDFHRAKKKPARKNMDG